MSDQEIQEAPVVAEAPAPAQETTPEPTPAPETPVEATPEPASDGPLSEETLQEAEEKADEPEEKPKRTRFQERIDKLTADKYAAEREARALRDRLDTLEQRERPPIDEDDFEAQESERLRRVFEEERKWEAGKDIERKQVEAQQARQELFRAKLDAARERIPDLDSSIEQFARLPVTPESAEIIADSPKAAELAHYLGRHPDVAYEIANMSPAMQGRAIAQIENRVSLPQKRVSSAPPPPAKLQPSAAPQEKSPEEMTAAEYLKWRQAQWK